MDLRTWVQVSPELFIYALSSEAAPGHPGAFHYYMTVLGLSITVSLC